MRLATAPPAVEEARSEDKRNGSEFSLKDRRLEGTAEGAEKNIYTFYKTVNSFQLFISLTIVSFTII